METSTQQLARAGPRDEVAVSFRNSDTRNGQRGLGAGSRGSVGHRLDCGLQPMDVQDSLDLHTSYESGYSTVLRT